MNQLAGSWLLSDNKALCCNINPNPNKHLKPNSDKWQCQKLRYFFHASTAVLGLGLLVVEVSRSNPSTPDSSGRAVGLSQRSLPDNHQHSEERVTSMSPAGFKPVIPARKRPQTHAPDRGSTEIGEVKNNIGYYKYSGDRGSSVVKVLCYKSEGRLFDPSWWHCNFLLT